MTVSEGGCSGLRGATARPSLYPALASHAPPPRLHHPGKGPGAVFPRGEPVCRLFLGKKGCWWPPGSASCRALLPHPHGQWFVGGAPGHTNSLWGLLLGSYRLLGSCRLPRPGLAAQTPLDRTERPLSSLSVPPTAKSKGGTGWHEAGSRMLRTHCHGYGVVGTAPAPSPRGSETRGEPMGK